jgi:hypothetical protein
MAASMKMTAFWDKVPSSLTEVYEVHTASIIRSMSKQKVKSQVVMGTGHTRHSLLIT